MNSYSRRKEQQKMISNKGMFYIWFYQRLNMIKYFSFRDSFRYLYPNKAIRPNSCKGIQADTGIRCMGNETGHTET